MEADRPRRVIKVLSFAYKKCSDARGEGRERGSVFVTIFKLFVAQRTGGINLRCNTLRGNGFGGIICLAYHVVWHTMREYLTRQSCLLLNPQDDTACAERVPPHVSYILTAH